jgi:hypothetical protein
MRKRAEKLERKRDYLEGFLSPSRQRKSRANPAATYDASSPR